MSNINNFRFEGSLFGDRFDTPCSIYIVDELNKKYVELKNVKRVDVSLDYSTSSECTGSMRADFFKSDISIQHYNNISQDEFENIMFGGDEQ